MKIIDNLEHRGVNYCFKQWVTWNGQLASGYSCEDRNLLRGLTVKSITATTNEEMIDLINFYIEAYSDLLYTQELSVNAARAWYEMYPNDTKD